jgi:tetratricopeptide (TPR) repeat protein
MAVFGKVFPTAAALLVAVATSGAQAPAAGAKPACDIADASKGNVAKASLMFDRARAAATGPGAENDLKSAVKLLETPGQGDDPVGRAYVLGETLSLWMNQPNVGLAPKRGAVGFSSNPDASIDLVGTVDSLFKIVETAKPACADYTAYYRGGQKFYLDLANSAINSLNADKLDSAEFYATQANRIYPGSPYGLMVLGNVASKRSDNAKAVSYWSSAAEVAGRDTTYRDVRRQMLSNVGSVYLANANSASGAARTTAARNAATAYGQLIEVPATRGSYLYGGRQNYQTALLLAGDTSAFVASYQPLLANPSTYEYQDLLNSAVNAARANRAADAAKLFEATLAQNPYNRDALFNLAVTYLTLEQNDKVSPIVTRLIAVDPGNPENYNLSARAYLALAKAAQVAKKTPVAAAYNDSTLTWYNRGNKLPVEVTFSEFSPSDKQLVIGGTVLDRRDKVDASTGTAAPARGRAAAKPAAKSLPPKPVTLNFQAIDKNGQVLGTQSVTTEALTPGKSAKFTVTIAAPNAAAYRYTIAD